MRNICIIIIMIVVVIERLYAVARVGVRNDIYLS